MFVFVQIRTKNPAMGGVGRGLELGVFGLVSLGFFEDDLGGNRLVVRVRRCFVGFAQLELEQIVKNFEQAGQKGCMDGKCHPVAVDGPEGVKLLEKSFDGLFKIKHIVAGDHGDIVIVDDLVDQLIQIGGIRNVGQIAKRHVVLLFCSLFENVRVNWGYYPIMRFWSQFFRLYWSNEKRI